MLITHDFPPEFPPLTERQAQVLGCLGDHMTTKEIARVLDISPSMVDQHLRAISHKMGGVPRRELARLHAEHVLRTRATALPRTPALPDRDRSIPSPAAAALPIWHSSFAAGFLAGLACGILVVLATFVSVTVLMGAR